jgi:hypothetical protein
MAGVAFVLLPLRSGKKMVVKKSDIQKVEKHSTLPGSIVRFKSRNMFPVHITGTPENFYKNYLA